MRKINCFKCDTLINDYNYMLVAIEQPYTNLFFHRDCYNEIDDIKSFVSENVEKLYNIIEKPFKKEKNN